MKAIRTIIKCMECGEVLDGSLTTYGSEPEAIVFKVRPHTCAPTSEEFDRNFIDRLLTELGDQLVHVHYSGRVYRGFFSTAAFTNAGFDPDIHVGFLKEVYDGFQPRMFFITELEAIIRESDGYRFDIV